MGDPIRILHVVVNMNRGGAETLLMNLYRNVDRTKVQFDFLTCKEGVFDQEIVSMGGNVHRIPYITDIGHYGYMKALEHFFATQREYNIVHSHMDKMSGLVLRSARRNQIPIRIAHSHSTRSEGSFTARLYKWYAGKNILPSATHLLACSNAAARWLFKNRNDEVKIIQNGIECEQFAFSQEVRNQVRKELELDQHFVMGHVGRFNHPKNHSFLVDLFAQIVNVIPKAKLVLVGDGPLRREIEEKIQDLHLKDKVKILGVRSDIHRLLQGFDLFVFPSLHEGLPVTLIEAQGSGLPCLISDVITDEVDMGLGLIHYASLQEKSKWLDVIKRIAESPVQRVSSYQSLREKGYDIKRTAAWTEGFYSAI